MNKIKIKTKIFIGSILGLIIAYFVRFYSLSCNGLKSSYEKLNKSTADISLELNTKFKRFKDIPNLNKMCEIIKS